MNVPTHGDLIHMKIQAAMRENDFATNDLMYLGERDNEHWYLIAGQHEVAAGSLEGFERIDDEE
jgi:hypothetical protein